MAEARTRRRRIRGLLACLLAPAAVAPLMIVGRIAVLEMPWHWRQYWWEQLLYFSFVSYFGSALAAPLVMLAMRMRRRGVSIVAVWGWFVLICSTLGAIILTLIGRHSEGPLLGLSAGGFVLALVGSAPVGLAYGLIAGLPWRVRATGDKAEAAADLPA